MRVRRLIAEKKILQSDTSWSERDLQPRYAPIYTRTKPIRAGWRWRSARVESGQSQFFLLAECNPRRDNWKALLIVERDTGSSVVARLEYHSSHPGLHAHTHCTRSGVETGASGLDNLKRYPASNRWHRRIQAWTENSFWEAAKRFFKIEDPRGPLI